MSEKKNASQYLSLRTCAKCERRKKNVLIFIPYWLAEMSKFLSNINISVRIDVNARISMAWFSILTK